MFYLILWGFGDKKTPQTALESGILLLLLFFLLIYFFGFFWGQNVVVKTRFHGTVAHPKKNSETYSIRLLPRNLIYMDVSLLASCSTQAQWDCPAFFVFVSWTASVSSGSTVIFLIILSECEHPYNVYKIIDLIVFYTFILIISVINNLSIISY